MAARAAGYSLPGVIADGNDVLDVYEECNTAVERARKGEGPTLLECKTYRVEGHCMVLKDLPQHRPKQEVEEWAKKDPIDVFEQKMIMMGEISNKSRIEIDQKINREFEEAIAFAKSSPFPDVQEFKEKVL